MWAAMLSIKHCLKIVLAQSVIIGCNQQRGGVTNAYRDRDECKEVIGGSSIVSNTDQRNSSPSRIVEAGDRLSRATNALCRPHRGWRRSSEGVQGENHRRANHKYLRTGWTWATCTRLPSM